MTNLTCTPEQFSEAKTAILSRQKSRTKPFQPDEIDQMANRSIIASLYKKEVENQLSHQIPPEQALDEDRQLAVRNRIIASLAQNLKVVPPSQN